MQTEPTRLTSWQQFRFFLPALLACVVLTAAVIRLDFESGSPIARVLPILPLVFTAGFWFPRYAFHAMLAGSFAASYLFLGIYNSVAVVLIITVYLALFRFIRTTRLRVAVAALFTAGLMFLRMGILNLPVVPLAVPVAGTMIMFRYILMLYEHHYATVQSTWIQKSAYLLLLPALAFPLYPIVDYKAFITQHRPKDASTIRTGLTRMTAGLLFLMLYRILYLYVIPSFVEVHDAASAMLYMASNYLYVLNIMGVLWLGIGYLGLLGFALPPVFNNIFLVDSFRDIWRRINTYWRDFVVKLVYYPLYFRLRKKTKYVIIIISLITLTISALLHGWQWFWLQGTIAFQSTGIIFWTIIGLVISINLSLQPKNEAGLPVASGKKSKALRALRITGMLGFMSFMWSLWNSPSVADWTYFLHFFGEGTAAQWGAIALAVGVVFLLVLLVLHLPAKPAGYHPLDQPRPVLLALGAGVLLLLPTLQDVRESIPGKTGEFVMSVSGNRLTAADQGDVIENYYNRMLASDGFGMRPWEMHTPGAPAKSGLDEACVRREDILVRELIPGKVTVLDGWSIATNRWGMRDQEYTKEKPQGVFRIAILGASYEMGSGVVQDSIFETLAEKMLNDSGIPVEILNFSVGGYHLPQQVWVAQNKIGAFDPDLVLCCVHPSDATRNSNYLCKLIKNGTNLVYPELYAIKKKSGAEQYMSENELKNRLYPYSDHLAVWSLESISKICDSLGADFGVVYIPAVQETNDVEFYRQLFTPGNAMSPLLGQTAFYDLSALFAGREEEFKLEADPTHPNGKAHHVIASGLVKKLMPYLERNISTHESFSP